MAESNGLSWFSNSKHPILAELPAWAERDIVSLRDFIASLNGLVDALLVPDLPTGRVRKDSILTIGRIKSFSDIDVVAGLSARHRSLEATVSRLLAFWDMGVKSVYIVMGDPTPTSSSGQYVFSKATELIRLAKDIARNGRQLVKGLHDSPRFKVGSALLPSRKNECRLLKKKLDAGTDFLITQIIFDPSPLASFLESCKVKKIENLPIFVSLPLVAKASSLSRLEHLDGVYLPKRKKEELLASDSLEHKAMEMGVETFKMCKRLKIEKLGAYILPLPGSRMESKLAEELRKL